MSPALDLYAPPQRRRPADVAKDQRLPQTSPLVNYRYGIDPEQSCGTCTMFQPPGGCASVTGMIRPVDTCDLWERDPSKTPPVSQPWALPAEQPANGVSQAPEVDDPEQLQQPGNPEDPTQAGVYAPQPRKGVVGPVRASLVGAREPAQAYFAHRDPARAYFVIEPSQAYFKEAGTPEGAKKGWMTRKGGQPRSDEDIEMIKANAKRSGLPEERAAELLDQTDDDMKKQGFTITPQNTYRPSPEAAKQMKRMEKERARRIRDARRRLKNSEAAAPVRATLVEVGTKEGGRKGSLTRRGRNALMRRLAKSEREISMGLMRIGKVRV